VLYVCIHCMCVCVCVLVHIQASFWHSTRSPVPPIGQIGSRPAVEVCVCYMYAYTVCVCLCACVYIGDLYA
jgi:hypothetical protein